MNTPNTRFLDEIKKSFSSEAEFNDFVDHLQKPLKRSITINTSKISPEKLVEETTSHGWTLTPAISAGKNDVFYIDREDMSTALGNTFWHQGGYIYIQEVAASIPPQVLNPTKTDLILDMCAAPGGKSVQLSHYAPEGFVVSNDMDAVRIKSLGFNLMRMGVTNGGITHLNGMAFGKSFPDTFDKVLLDAPCSGEGTGFKSDFALSIRRQSEINKIAGIQYQLLISALKTVKSGGEIIYSTCTVNPYENELNIKKFLEEYENHVSLLSIDYLPVSSGLFCYDGQEIISRTESEKMKRFRPHKEKTGGFFVCRLQKTASLPKSKEHTFVNHLAKKQISQHEWRDYLRETYGITQFHHYIQTGKYIYATSKRAVELEMPFERIGCPIAKEIGRLTHSFGVVYGEQTTKNYATLTRDQAQSYILGEDLHISDIDLNRDEKTPYIVLKYKDYGISVGKIIGTVLKNKAI